MPSPTTSRAVRRKPAPIIVERTPGTIWGFNYRRPFDALWNIFSSLRTMVIIMAAILTVSIVGMLIIQAPAEVVSSPSDYAAWVATTANDSYKQFTNFMDWAQFFTIFRSWYFKVLIVLLAINILVGGMLNRAPNIWAKFRHPQLKRAEGFFRNSPVRVGVTLGDEGATTTETSEQFTAFLHKRGYRVTVAPESNNTVQYLYVHKYTWSSLSTFIFHTCLILTMLCAVLTGWGGFGNDSMAERILPASVYNYFQDLAGFSYNQPLPNGEQGVVYPQGTPHNIFYRAQNFVADFDPIKMTPTDFYTDLQLYQDGKLVAQKRIRVNDPLTYQGVTFHQASFMMYTSFALRDAQGNVIFSGPVPLLDHTTATNPNDGNVSAQANSAYDVPLANFGETMNVSAVALPDSSGSATGEWGIRIDGYDQAGKVIFGGASVISQQTPSQSLGCVVDQNTPVSLPDQYGCKLSNGSWLQVNDLRRGTVLLVTKDAGSPLLWPVLLLLIFSVWVTFGFPPRRIWARIEGDQVRIAALKEHFINLQRELDSFARALGNRPLRPDPEPERKRKETREATPASV